MAAPEILGPPASSCPQALRRAQDMHLVDLGRTPTQEAGFALLRKGFRPFFLLGAVFAVGIIPLWLFVLSAWVRPASVFDAYAWHANQMLFGFATAVIAGFLLTAVSNWTGDETVVGRWLGVLAGLWIAGRLAVTFSAKLPWGLGAAIDLLFLPALAIGIGRPLVARRNLRNFVMLGVLAVLFALDVAMHLGSLGILPGWERRAALAGVDVVVLLIVIISGRVIPMFTRTGAHVQTVHSWTWADRAAGVSMLALVGTELARPDATTVLRVLAAVASGLTLVRSLPWLTPKMLRVPLVWSLHLAHAWIPVGLALRALDLPGSTHALTVGTIGGMCLSMMSRVSLGHTGRPILAGRLATVSFALLAVAAGLRVTVAFAPSRLGMSLMHSAGTLWMLAFGLYVAGHARMLLSPRVDGKPG